MDRQTKPPVPLALVPVSLSAHPEHLAVLPERGFGPQPGTPVLSGVALSSVLDWQLPGSEGDVGEQRVKT